MAKRSKADFDYELKEKDGIKFLLIEDMNSGGKSVTNDIENIIDDLDGMFCTKERIVLYSDSDGNWDGWNQGSNAFFHVGGTSAEEAMQNYINKYKSGK